jgi:hypothetical protein
MNVWAKESSEIICGSCETSWPRQNVAVSNDSATSATLSSDKSTCNVPVSSSICVRSGPCRAPSSCWIMFSR